MRDSGHDVPSPFLERLAEHVSDVLWVFSGSMDELVFVNPAYEAVWGRPAAALREDPRDLLEGVHPDDRGAAADAMDRLAAGDAIDVEWRVDADEGHRRWVRVRAEPVRDEGGTRNVVVANAKEITERKRRRSERDRYRTIIRNIPDGVYLFDRDGELSFANRAAVDRSALPRDELIGGSVSELLEASMVDDTPVEDVLALHESLTAGDREEFRETLWFETVDGPRPFAVRSARGESEDGELVGVVSVLRDIMDRVEAERELRRKTERLEQFASLLSHDLRNPLGVATGRLELAREECDSDHLDEIEGAHERMATLIEDLLTLARVGEEATELETVALAEAVEECWGNVGTGEATLVADAEGTIHAAESRLQQLLENLIRNAVEHGGGDATVRIGDLADGFYVEDDGPGIPEDARERLFESGYSTTETGSGLGLNIVEGIVEAHGWDVRVTDGRDGGARFEITGVERAE